MIQAVRYALSDAGASVDAQLRPALLPMLETMLRDAEVENRRLALTTVHSALRSKPGLILPHLAQLLPYVYTASEVDPTLIREVQMGPFKHKVDDGLETRKVGFCSLTLFLPSFLPSLPSLLP